MPFIATYTVDVDEPVRVLESAQVDRTALISRGSEEPQGVYIGYDDTADLGSKFLVPSQSAIEFPVPRGMELWALNKTEGRTQVSVLVEDRPQ